MPVIPMTKLGRLLAGEGVISEAQLDEGLAVQQTTGRKLSLWLLEHGILDEATLSRYLAKAAGVEHVTAERLDAVPPEVGARLAAPTAAQAGAVPVEVTERGLVVATSEPERLEDLGALEAEVGLPVVPALATRTDVARTLARLYGVTDTTLWIDADEALQAIAAAAPADPAEEATQQIRRDDAQRWLASYRSRGGDAGEGKAPISPDEAVWVDETPAEVPTVGIHVAPGDLDDRATLAYQSPLAAMLRATTEEAEGGEEPPWEADTAPPQADPLRSTARFGAQAQGASPLMGPDADTARLAPVVPSVADLDTLDAVQSVRPEAGLAPATRDKATEEPLPGRPKLCGIPGMGPGPAAAGPAFRGGAAPGQPSGARFAERYQLLDRLGVGGMAEVWRARVVGAEGFRRMVVVKKILPEYTTNREFVEMFIDEAKIACQLSHPNIAQIYELGQEDGEYSIAMEYVDGPDLETVFERARTKGPKLTPSLAAYVVEQLCEGLDHAHRKTDERGQPLYIIHRDVTPHNVLVSYEGHVKIIDFGIAKAAAKTNVTRVGYMKGKPGYIAPEQALGMRLDHRVDVFAAGILLYELLTHRRLFSDSASAQEFKKLARFDVKPLLRWQLKLPSALRALTTRALQVRPEDRLPTAGDLAAGLREFLRKRKRDPRAELVAYLRTNLPPVGGWEGPSAM